MKDEEDNLSVFISYAWGGALEKKNGSGNTLSKV